MKTATVMIIGDVIGQPGIRALVSMLPGLKRKFSPDFVVVNGENAADGFGITEHIAQTIFSCGADVITTGNHIWQQREILPYLNTVDTILRPANYPAGAPGNGFGVYERKGVRLGVINLQGRVRMWPIDCPFKKAKEILRKIESQTDLVVIDMHAESPDEKEALAWEVDGHVQAVVGTHTHIQTCDERILPNGTAYLSDVGATGPRDSIIGFDPETGIQRSLTQLPLKSGVSTNPAVVCGVVVRVDRETRKACEIVRIREASAV